LGYIVAFAGAIGRDDPSPNLDSFLEDDMTVMTNWTKKHSLLAFFALAYAFSWLVEIPLALAAQGVIQAKIPFALHYLAAYGPMCSALTVTGVTMGRRGLRDLLGKMTKWRLNPGWWLVALAPLGFYLLVTVAIWLLQGEPINLIAMGQVDFLRPLGLAALPLWVLTFGIGEETGWRGFALPRLQEGRSSLNATIVLWVFWALWHLPLFFYSYDVSILPGFLIGLLAGAIIFTWLYNSTGGSILLVALWHGTFNFTTACSSCKTGLLAAVISTLVMVWAVAIVLFYRSRTFSRTALHDATNF
jgi:membrane protease YdiL (CAAX protease family)